MVFTDDYSRCLFTYFLKKKSDAFKATEEFLSDIAHYGKVKTLNFYEDVFPAGDVKRMRSDNGGEYLAGNFKALPASTSAHSPHQNINSERNWRTSFEMARCLIVESKLPKNLRTYALMTATYIRN